MVDGNARKRSLTRSHRGDSLQEEEHRNSIPRNVTELITEAEAAGFVSQGGQASRPVTLAGREGGDAKAYQEKAVRSAIPEAQQ